MSNARHAGPRQNKPAVEPAAPPVRGRHRATPARQLGRGSVVAGAAALSLAAAGGLASASTGVPMAEPAVTDSAVTEPAVADSAVDGLVSTLAAPVTAASRGEQRAALPAAAVASAAAEQSARAAARDLLAQRTAAIEQAAAAAAAAKLGALHKACDYVSSVQRHPEHNATQLKNVRTIVEVAEALKLPPRAAVIAVATAQQESELINMSGGDRDSVGLFQQRPSMGWGSYREVHDPTYAAEQFYAALTAIPGWTHLPLTVAAQKVQSSAFGWAYARWEASATQLVAQVTDAPVDQLNCTPR
jgi:hypothetical protein